jgi:glutamate--cysteine ligase
LKLDEKLQKRLIALRKDNAAELLFGGLRGLEKESLRVAESGGIAQTRHPENIGSALTNPWITTDYSEALTEFITPPMVSSQDALCFLQDAQTFVYRRLQNEKLWATSMPCILHGGKNIPLAQYGNSNAGIMKTVYRRGLGYRYGRVMQVISGVHFNYSVPEVFWQLYYKLENSSQSLQQFRNDCYMGLVRNLQRFGWLIPYLMGASPAVCKSFFGDQQTELDVFDNSTYYEPYATSLRMGDIGYQNSKEEGLGIKANYDSLEKYVDSLRCAISTPAALWENIGVVVDGKWRQLNANILQIENEYYSTVRPKTVLNGLEKPVDALIRNGIEYIELRSLDVNAYHPLGIDQLQLDFLEVLVLFCLLHDSPLIGEQERHEIDLNIINVAHKGRTPLLKLRRAGDFVELKLWGEELFNAMRPIAEILDVAGNTHQFSQALQHHKAMIDDPDKTPSAIMLAEMCANGEGFYAFANRMSQSHKRYFDVAPLSSERLRFFQQSVQESHLKQQQIEAEDNMTFAEFMQAYESSGL